MAVFESQIATRIRGSAGEITFCQGQYSAIVMRAKISDPFNPNTAAQQNVRTSFQTASTAWNTISQAFRDGWSLYAQTIMTRKPFGSAPLTGRTAFLAVFSFAHFVLTKHGAVPVITYEPPSLPGYLAPGIVADIPYVVGASVGYAFNFLNTSEEAVYMYTSYTQPQNLARLKWDGVYEYGARRRRSLAISANLDVSIPIGGTYTGKCLFSQFRVLSQTQPFRISDLITLRSIATTNP